MFGVGLVNAAVAVGIAGIPRFARVVRGATLSLMGRDFVKSAHALGAKRARVVLRHLLANQLPTLVVLATLDLGNTGREYVRYASWMMVYPGLALFLTVMAVNLVGDRLNQVFDPRSTVRR